MRVLRRFYEGTLPVAPVHHATVQAALVADPGAIDNASGSHPLDAAWRDGLTLSAKTGATVADDGTSVSWLVGRLTRAGRHHVFASAVWRRGGAVDALEGARAAIRALTAQGLLAPR